MTATVVLTVPFAGFYESWHSYEIDHAEEMISQDDSGNPMFSIFEHCDIDYSCVWLEYAKAYVDLFSENFGLSISFESMSSPREYNFTTDRIFGEMRLANAYLMLRAVRADGRLDKYAKSRFTSYDGFRSFYSPDWRTWGPASEWDHNQWGTVLCAYVDSDGDEFREWESMGPAEAFSCNGDVDSWLWEAMSEDSRALLNIALDFLRENYDWPHPFGDMPTGLGDSLMTHGKEHGPERLKTLCDYLAARLRRPHRTTADQRAAMLPFADTPLGAAL